jgi:hypothetical protein
MSGTPFIGGKGTIPGNEREQLPLLPLWTYIVYCNGCMAGSQAGALNSAHERWLGIHVRQKRDSGVQDASQYHR